MNAFLIDSFINTYTSEALLTSYYRQCDFFHWYDLLNSNDFTFVDKKGFLNCKIYLNSDSTYEELRDIVYKHSFRPINNNQIYDPYINEYKFVHKSHYDYADITDYRAKWICLSIGSVVILGGGLFCYYCCT